MASHRRWWLVGSVQDVVQYQWDNPTLETVPIYLSTPERLVGARINPWDEVVCLPSYFDGPADVRQDVASLLSQARERGRQID